MNALAWLLTYALPIALIAFGTVTQGDDDAWWGSLFIIAPVATIGCLMLSLTSGSIRRYRWMSVFHLVTVLLASTILPGYWVRVTIARDHIGAGFSTDYVRSFDPELWHFWWAPVMTGLVAWVIFLTVRAFRTKQEAQQAGSSNGG